MDTLPSSLGDPELRGRKVTCFLGLNFRPRSHRVIGSIAPSHAKVSRRQESAVGVDGQAVAGLMRVNWQRGRAIRTH